MQQFLTVRNETVRHILLPLKQKLKNLERLNKRLSSVGCICYVTYAHWSEFSGASN